MKGVKFLEIHVPKFEKFKTKTLLLPLLTLTFDQFRLTFYEFKFRVVCEFENVKFKHHIFVQVSAIVTKDLQIAIAPLPNTENTHSRGSFTLQLVSSLTSLNSTASSHTDMFSFSIKSSLVKLETSCKVIQRWQFSGLQVCVFCPSSGSFLPLGHCLSTNHASNFSESYQLLKF